ncbi:MAG: DUF2141 domain-containing protein [Syntrophobacterales bacterium]|jgi:uncharacterized protein (DUF2141 family)|nr:DUF2141 domain-containing protein [Syntrophobacterales bacterium]
MKQMWAVLMLLLMTGAAPAATLTVTVSNGESDQGCVSVALYNIDTSQNFGSGSGYYQGKHGNIASGTAQVVFSNIPYGTYAVAAFHDLDCSGVIKKNFWGIPQTMYGFSNNYGKRPDFNQASFLVTGDTKIAIRLQWY